MHDDIKRSYNPKVTGEILIQGKLLSGLTLLKSYTKWNLNLTHTHIMFFTKSGPPFGTRPLSITTP